MSLQQTFSLTALGLYTVVILGLLMRSLWLNSGRDHSIVDDAVGSRSYGAVAIAVTVAATMLGPADALALSEKGLQYGLIWVMFPLGAAAAQLTSGLIFAPRLRTGFQNALSLGDIFDTHCGRFSRVVAGLIIFVQMIAFSGVLIMAGGTLLQEFLGIDPVFGMIYTAVLVGAYSSFGGLSLVVLTDKLQFGFVVFIGLMCFSTILFATAVGSDTQEVVVQTDLFSTDHSITVVLTLFSGYFLGELLLPFYSQRALIAENGRSARLGFVGAAGIIALWYLIVTAAGSISAFSDTVQSDSSILMGVSRGLFEPGSISWHIVGAIIFAGFVALIHSTFDSILNAGAVGFARDFLGGMMNLDAKFQGWISRQVVISIAVLGILVAMVGDDLIELLMLGYTFWVPTLLVPLAWIIMNPRKRLAPAAFAASICGGLAGWWVFEHAIDSAIPGILGGFAGNLVMLLLVARLIPGGEPREIQHQTVEAHSDA